MKWLVGLLGAAALVVLAGCGEGGEGPPVLRFTAIPNQNTTLLRQKFQPVAEYLAKETGLAVEYVPAADYQASVAMFKTGDVHLAWFGGLTGVQARRAVPGARAIAMGAEDREFRCYFIANASTGLSASEEFPAAIAGLSFTFGSESSTSGRLMPESFIREHSGKSAAEFFGHPPAFSGSHDRTAEQVESGAFQAGVLDYSVWERRVREGRTDPQVCRVIWKSPPFADYNFSVRPDVDRVFGAGTADRLQRALLDMAEPKLLAAFDRSRLVAATDADFENVRETAESLGMLR